MDIKTIKEKAADAAAELRNLDMGNLVTKATTVAAKLDIDDIKKKVNDVIDSPETDKVKGVLRTAAGFVEMAPNYVQSLIGSFKK